MNEITFGRLTDLVLRDAWSNEERDFTPWLLENLDHIGDSIGISLEPVDREIRVGPFEADILAINPQDGTRVLIENQLESADHRHLGQIMTYLAGLDARTVIWIAPRFADEHLSVIDWLNEHTPDGFSFFAVRLRVVRIADSPLAPILEVVQKPNGWDRQLADVRRRSNGDSPLGDARLAYWTAYVARHSETRVRANRGSYVSFAPERAPQAKVVLWIGRKKVGIFVRPNTGVAEVELAQVIEPVLPRLEDRLGIAGQTGSNTGLGQTITASVDDPSTWTAAQEWQEEQLERYLAALDEILGGDA